MGQFVEVLAEPGLPRPLVLCDPFTVCSGLIDRCLAPLGKADIEAAVFGGNPRSRAIALMRLPCTK